MHDEHDVLRITHGLEHLAAADQVERELALALLRLSRDPWTDPRNTGRNHAANGKPIWWWKVRLIEWAGSAQAGLRCDREALRGFRLYIRDVSDEELTMLVRGALNQEAFEESA